MGLTKKRVFTSDPPQDLPDFFIKSDNFTTIKCPLLKQNTLRGSEVKVCYGSRIRTDILKEEHAGMMRSFP